jgi:hypothetical protein
MQRWPLFWRSSGGGEWSYYSPYSVSYGSSLVSKGRQSSRELCGAEERSGVQCGAESGCEMTVGVDDVATDHSGGDRAVVAVDHARQAGGTHVHACGERGVMRWPRAQPRQSRGPNRGSEHISSDRPILDGCRRFIGPKSPALAEKYRQVLPMRKWRT